MSTTRHQVCVRLMKERSSRNQGHGYFHGVHLIEIFFAGFCAASHSQNSIFAVEIDRDFFRQIVRDESETSAAEIHEAAIRQLARSTLGDLFSRHSPLVR